MNVEEKQLPPTLLLSFSKQPAWIASTPSDYDFPHSPAARDSILDSFASQMGDALPDLQKTQSLNSNSKENAKEVQGMKIDRVLPAVKPKSEIQDVGSCFLKRCDSVARRSKAYEAAARTKCSK